MALWTLFGLTSGKATTAWPREGQSDGQDGVLGMPRYNPDACREGCEECASVCPTHAIEARDGGLAIDYGRCVVCQLCTEVCPSGAMEPSHVLAAMGVDKQLAEGALRLTLGRTTTQHDVDRSAEVLVAAVRRLRAGGGR